MTTARAAKHKAFLPIYFIKEKVDRTVEIFGDAFPATARFGNRVETTCTVQKGRIVTSSIFSFER